MGNENRTAGVLARAADAVGDQWTVGQLRDTLDQYPPNAPVVVVAQADPTAARVFGYDIGGCQHRLLLPPDDNGVVFLVPNTAAAVELTPPPRPVNRGGDPDGDVDADPTDADTTLAARTARQPDRGAAG